MFSKENEKPKKKKSKGNEIVPLKDFHIKHNEFDIKLIKGEPIEVPEKFLENLKTEKVI